MDFIEADIDAAKGSGITEESELQNELQNEIPSRTMDGRSESDDPTPVASFDETFEELRDQLDDGLKDRFKRLELSDTEYSGEDEADLEDYIDDRIQREWDESMRELQVMASFVLIPVIGKYFGRRFSRYVWQWYVDYRNRA